MSTLGERRMMGAGIRRSPGPADALPVERRIPDQVRDDADERGEGEGDRRRLERFPGYRAVSGAPNTGGMVAEGWTASGIAQRLALA